MLGSFWVSALVSVSATHAAPVLNQVGIVPCAVNFGCVNVEDQAYRMVPDGRKIGRIEILAHSDDYALVRVPVEDGKRALALYQIKPSAGIVAFGMEKSDQVRPTKEQLTLVIHDRAFLAYLNAPADRETKSLDLVLEEFEHAPSTEVRQDLLYGDIERLYELHMVDSFVDGKVNRLMEGLMVGRTYPNRSLFYRIFLMITSIRPVTFGKPETPATDRSNAVRAFEKAIAAALSEGA